MPRNYRVLETGNLVMDVGQTKRIRPRNLNIKSGFILVGQIPDFANKPEIFRPEYCIETMFTVLPGRYKLSWFLDNTDRGQSEGVGLLDVKEGQGSVAMCDPAQVFTDEYFKSWVNTYGFDADPDDCCVVKRIISDGSYRFYGNVLRQP